MRYFIIGFVDNVFMSKKGTKEHVMTHLFLNRMANEDFAAIDNDEKKYGEFIKMRFVRDIDKYPSQIIHPN